MNLSDKHKALAIECGFGSIKNKIFAQLGCFVSSEEQLALYTSKIQAEERERCAKQSARYYDHIAGIEIAEAIRSLE